MNIKQILKKIKLQYKILIILWLLVLLTIGIIELFGNTHNNTLIYLFVYSFLIIFSITGVYTGYLIIKPTINLLKEQAINTVEQFKEMKNGGRK